MTITEFLLARIAEDEAIAQAASQVWDPETQVHVAGEPAIWRGPPDDYSSGAVMRTNGEEFDTGTVVYDEGRPTEDEAAHIARHDPARVLAECAAKRRIVARATTLEAWDEMGSSTAEDGRDILEALAGVYADHPDYDQSWASDTPSR